MVVIVIVNNKGIGSCAGISSPDKAIGSLVLLLVESRHKALHK